MARSSYHNLIRILILTATLPFCLYASAGSVDHLLDLDLSSLQIETITAKDGNQYTRIHLDNTGCESTPGAFEIPVAYVNFVVPTYSNNFRVETIDRTTGIETTISHPVYPAQRALSYSEARLDIFTSPVDSIYGYDHTINSPYVLRERFIDSWDHIVTVAVPAVSFLSDHEISIPGSVALRLTYDECAPDDMSYSPLFTRSAAKRTSLDEYVVNPEDIDRPSRHKTMAMALDDPDNRYYVIIVPESLKEGVTDLTVWKRQKGYNVIVSTIESILADSKYKVGSTGIPDEAAALRAYLRSLHDRIADHFYCLLVGDYRTSMPIRKTFAKIGDGLKDNPKNNIHGSNYVPTDNYFADLRSTFDLTLYPSDDNPQIYSYLSEKHTYSYDIYVGRLLCTTVEEINNFTHKLVLYEANPGYGDNAYLDKAMGFEHPDMHEKNEYNLVMKEFLKRGYFNENIVLIGDNDKLLPTGEEIIEAMRGCGFVTWHGHGAPSSISVANNVPINKAFISARSSYNKKELREDVNAFGIGLDELKNDKYPMVGYAISCTISPFDLYITDYDHHYDKFGNKIENFSFTYDIPYNMGSSFTVAGKYGGPVLISNTREGKIGSSALLERVFAEYVIMYRKIGESLFKAKDFFITIPPKITTQYSTDSKIMLHDVAVCNIIGDPEMDMWLCKPNDTPQILVGFPNNQIYLSGMGLSGSCVTVSTGNHTIGKTYNSSSSLSFSPQYRWQDTGSWLVSVWNTGTLPFVRLYCRNKTMDNVSNRFIVREAYLGSKGDGIEAFTVGSGSNLTIKALDRIRTKEGFIIADKGVVYLECDGEIDLTGTVVKSGGELHAKGEKVKMGVGFKVEPGGKIFISSNN